MTITYDIDHLPGSTESVTVGVAPKSSMALISSDIDQKTGEVTAKYVINTGDPSYPAIATFRTALQRRADGVFRRISVTFETWASVTNSTTEEVVRKKISGTISALVPADVTIEVADLDNFLAEVYSFTYASVSSGTRSTTYLGKLLFGSPQVA